MNIYKQDLFTDSESNMLKKLLKNPEDDYNKVVSLFKKNFQEIIKTVKDSEETLLKNIPGMVYRGNPDWSTEIITNSEIISGYSLKQFNSRIVNWLNLIHPDDKDRVLEESKKLKEKPQDLKLIYRIIAKDGTVHWVDDRKVSRFTENGEFNGAEGIVFDITERKILEQKLIASEEKYRHLFKEFPISMFLFDENGNLIEANTHAYNSFSERLTDLSIGKNITEIILLFKNSEEILQIFKKRMLDRTKGKELKPIELKLVRHDGQEIWIHWHSSTLQLDNKNLIQAIVQDITDRKAMEQKLKESEIRYKSLIEQTTDAVFCYEYAPPIPIDLPIEKQVKRLYDCILVHCNLVCAQFYGYNRVEDVVGRKLTDLFGTTLESLDELFYKLIESQYHIIDGVGIEKLPNGEERYFLNNGHGIIENGKLLRVWGTYREITDKVKAEQKLKESEKKYRSVIDALTRIGIGIDIVDLNYKILYQNKVLQDIFGQSEEKLCYKTYLGLDESCDFCPMIKAVKNNKIESAITPAPNGRIYEVISAPLSNVDGIIDRAAEVVIDITERKQAEEKLKESEEKFRNIAEQSLMGICIIQDDVIKYTNQAMADLYGYSIEEMLNWGPGEFAKVVAPESLDMVMEQVKKKQSNNPTQIIHYTIHCVKKSGELIWVDNISKTINYNGKSADLITQIDITERMIAKQELIELNKLKSDLLIRTSHELKTPLISIKGFTDLLLKLHREKLETDTLSIIEEIHEGCERLEDLIINLLESSKLEADDIELQVSYEDLAFLIRFCVKDLRFWAKSRNHKISLEIHNIMMTMFEKERIYEVLNNLLGNAIKYTPPNGNIKIKSETKDDFYIISVQDNGIGFTKNEKKKLFTQFGKIERYGRGWDVIIEGTGMGLYISKKIVELHGGKIWMESEGRNKGSTFYFSLPIKKV